MKGSRPLTSEETQHIKKVFSGRMASRNLALFLLGANTGFRVSELLSLTLDHILEENGKIKDNITVQRRNMKGKTEGRTVVLNDYGKKGIYPWLKELNARDIINRDDYLFPSIRSGGSWPIDRTQAWRVLAAAYKAGGFTGKLGTHAMRKTFANNIYDDLLRRAAAGEALDPFRAVSKALGHKDIKSTDQYLSFRNDDINQSIFNIGV